jgi:hypothetical protein
MLHPFRLLGLIRSSPKHFDPALSDHEREHQAYDADQQTADKRRSKTLDVKPEVELARKPGGEEEQQCVDDEGKQSQREDDERAGKQRQNGTKGAVHNTEERRHQKQR